MAALRLCDVDARLQALVEVVLRQRLEAAHADLVGEHLVGRARRLDGGHDVQGQRLDVFDGQAALEIALWTGRSCSCPPGPRTGIASSSYAATVEGIYKAGNLEQLKVTPESRAKDVVNMQG